MSKLYHAEVNDSWIRADGLGWWVSFGEARTVDGEPHVHLKHGIFPAEGWHESRADAVRAAADRIEQLGHRLLDQAARVRAEADAPAEVTA
jgi:hypothetical protein